MRIRNVDASFWQFRSQHSFIVYTDSYGHQKIMAGWADNDDMITGNLVVRESLYNIDATDFNSDSTMVFQVTGSQNHIAG